ncbi:MAG TPA: alpha-E domain-containing protein [Armatimonadota bacterium]|nr:alpha-E domain-containing protein [Armatimonadota bacterium]
MLSRVANSIYWMNRYVERAENVARFIEVNVNLMLDLPAGVDEQWAPLVHTTGDIEAFRERYGTASKQNVLEFLTFDVENPNSILSSLRMARENARTVREIISSEMWEQINIFSLMVEAAAAHRDETGVSPDLYAEIKQASHLFGGISHSTMSHGEAWHFGRLGRFLERADKTSRILDVKYFILLPGIADVGSPFDTLQWAALLKSASALEMYRKRFGLISPARVADFLILDREFPRAMHFCVVRAEESVRAITGSVGGTFRNPAEQQLGRLRAELNYAHIREIIGEGLHEFLDRFQSQINQADDCIFETFFALRPIAGSGAGLETNSDVLSGYES